MKRELLEGHGQEDRSQRLEDRNQKNLSSVLCHLPSGALVVRRFIGIAGPINWATTVGVCALALLLAASTILSPGVVRVT